MKPRVYIETHGCQMNVADSERAATGLRASGYDLCDSVDAADVVLLNTCSVREKAERKVYTRIGELRAGLLEFCLWISGKGRAAWLSCDDVPSDRHQGHEGDEKMRPPPHRAVIRICNLPLCPVRRGEWWSTPGGAETGPKVLHASSTRADRA